MRTEELKDTLLKLGFNLSDRGGYWQTSAIWRNGDNPTAVQIFKDSGVWKDFVDSPQPKPFEALVSKVLGTNDKKILSEYQINKVRRADIFENIDHKDIIKVEKTFNVEILKELLPHHKFYLEKKISQETLGLYRSGFCTRGKMNNRYVFPIFRYDDPELIIGFSGRNTLWSADQDNASKWKHIGTRSNWIYPLCLGREFTMSVQNTGVVYIVESIGDSLALTQNGIKNHIVTFGLNISQKQIMALLAFNPSKIVISMNNDSHSEVNRGLNAAIKNYIELLDFFDLEKIVIKLPPKNDLSQMHEEGIFKKWLDKSINQENQYRFILHQLKTSDIKFQIPKRANLRSKISLLSSILNEDEF